jgi:uncharacterized protein (TIGR02453 family)
LRFFQELADNNNRDWFEKHKQTYVEYVLNPAQAFVVELGERLHTLSDSITYDTRTNGAGSIGRIYRDIRFSADKSPYKTSLGMTFGPAGSKRGEGAGFMVHIDPTGAAVYVGAHAFSKPQLAAYRDAVVDETLGADLEASIAAVTQTGNYHVGGETLKRVPSGYDAGHPRANLLRYTALYAYGPRVAPAVVSTAEVVEACFEHCRNLLPLYSWLGGFAERARATA